MRGNEKVKISGILKKSLTGAALTRSETVTAPENQYHPPTRQKVEVYRNGVNEVKPMLRAAGEPSSCPTHLPSCICATGMGIWMGKAN